MPIAFNFPTELFILRRHESYALERFAYNVARIAASAIQSSVLPNQFSVHFECAEEFDVWITSNNDSRGDPVNSEVHASTAMPIILLGLCVYFGAGLTRDELEYWRKDTSKFRSAIEQFRMVFQEPLSAGAINAFEAVRREVATLGGMEVWKEDTANHFDRG
jgi:hypothetical protein